MMRSGFGELPLCRLALLAAPLVLIGFAAGVVHGPYRLMPDQRRQNGLILRSEPVRHVSVPETSHEDELGAVGPPPDPSITGSTKRAETLRALQPEILGRVFELYRKGDVSGGDRLREELLDPVERRLGAWAAVRFGPVGFDRIMAFKHDNADWPVTAALDRRAEEALLTAGKAPGFVRFFFADRAPTTAEGKIALALALRSDGAKDEAAELVRDAWRNHIFGAELEANILKVFAGVLTEVDHQERLERFLSRESWD